MRINAKQIKQTTRTLGVLVSNEDSHRFSGVSGVSAPRPSDSTGVLDSRSSSSETRNALDKSAAERLVGDGAEDQSREGMDAIDSEGCDP